MRTGRDGGNRSVTHVAGKKCHLCSGLHKVREAFLTTFMSTPTVVSSERSNEIRDSFVDTNMSIPTVVSTGRSTEINESLGHYLFRYFCYPFLPHPWVQET